MKVTAFLHDAARTGAPLVAVGLLERLVRENGVHLRTVVARDGPLVDRLRNIGSVVILEDEKALLNHRRLAFGVGYGALQAMQRRRLRRLVEDADIVYVNTLVLGRWVRRLPQSAPPVVTHVHELPRWVALWSNEDDVASALAGSDHFLAVSNAVQDDLLQRGVPSGRISLLRESIPLAGTGDRLRGRKEQGVDVSTFLVGAVGTVDRRKGADLFPLLALEVARRLPGRNVEFRWLGSVPEALDLLIIDGDVKLMGLDSRVRFLPATAAPADFIAALDVLVLPSREDAYPLVVLEAAAAGVPTVCFAGGGGAPEFAAEGGGRVIPYLDISAMADEVAHLLDHPDEHAEAARAARALVQQHDVESAGKRLHEILKNVACHGRRMEIRDRDTSSR